MNDRHSVLCRTLARTAAAALLFSAGSRQPNFPVFWRQFQAAVAQADAEAIADRTRLPFLFSGQALNRTAFLRIVPELFDTPARRCISAAKPLPDNSQRLIFCNGTIFVFTLTPEGWRFTEIGVDD